ncbi:MAG: acetate--CoA ligase family protein [Polyangia bacterium]|jgi:acetyltransferase|nr:acetate--CoA ligase family protein [Polyangia bacterium]
MNHPLEVILNPRSVVIAGASNNFMKMGTVQALSLLNQGFPGEVSFLHPTEPEVLGRPTYAAPRDLPGPVDLAILILPTAVVPPMLDELGQAGVRHAVIVSGGFRELGASGEALEAEIVEVARRHGIRFVGPNCIGVLNMGAHLNCTYFPNLSDARGGVGLISQSGTYVTQSLGWLQEQRLGLSQAVSVGNQADLDVVDVLEHFATCEDLKAIAIYLEGLRRAERFVEVARRTVAEAGKPIVALYVGGSEAGARAGASHTGALASPDAVMDGLLRQAGVLRVHSVRDLYRQTWMLAHQPPMKGRRLGVVTHSGGPAATIADAAERQGLCLPVFSGRLQADLMQDLPQTAQATNPVDMTYLLQLGLLSGALPEKVLSSGEVDGLVIHGIPGTGMERIMFENVRRLLPEGATYEVFKEFLATGDTLAPLLGMPARFGLPIVHSAFHDPHDEIMQRLLDAGLPTVDSPEEAALLLGRSHAAYAASERIRESLSQGQERMPGTVLAAVAAPVEAKAILGEALASGNGSLAEHEAKSLLGAWSMPLLPERAVTSSADAVAAACGLGFPVALKLSAPGLAHKTEAGAVRLHLTTEEGVMKAANQLLAMAPAGPRWRLLVSPMLADPRELTAGMTRLPGLPTCVMFGLGGIFAEALGDTSWRLAPFDLTEAHAMLDELRAARLLEDLRGLPPVRKEALARLLASLGALGMAHPEIRAVDINPILIDPDGQPVIVDALVEIEAPRTEH